VSKERKPRTGSSQRRNSSARAGCPRHSGRDARATSGGNRRCIDSYAMSGVLQFESSGYPRDSAAATHSTPTLELSQVAVKQTAQASVVSTNWLEDVAPPSWRHLPAGCRRYGRRHCPGIWWTLHQLSLEKRKGVPQVDYGPSRPSLRRGVPFDEIQEARK